MIRATPTNIRPAALNADPAGNSRATGSGRFKVAAEIVLHFCSSLGISTGQCK